MNAERLLQLYDRICQAPDAVSRLRRFVLDLAVRGKLVEQDPEDEPASELVKRIEAEKVRLAKAGEIKNSRPAKPLGPKEVPDNIPEGWKYLRLGAVIDVLSGQHLKQSEYARVPKSGIPYITGPSDFSDKGLRINKYALVRKAVAYRGQLLLTVKGSGVGKTAFCDLSEVAISRQLMALTPIRWNLKFLNLVTHRLAGRLQYQARSLIPGISRGDVEDFCFLLPPLDEQHRIVAKVDELMALCDRLEETHDTREATRDRLTTATLFRLTAPDTDEPTFRSHARFALDTLPALTARPDQIKNLRQTILNLAVRGKLVPQKADDEATNVSDAENLELDEPLPSNWRYVRLKNLLTEKTRNGYSRRPDDAKNGVPILRISAGTARPDGIVAEEEHKLISGIDEATKAKYRLNPGDLLACRFNGNRAFVGSMTLFANYLGLKPLYPDKLIRIRLDKQVARPDFIQMIGNSDVVRWEVEKFCATTVGNWGISASNLNEVPFPLPPLAEQSRIVAKLNELMTLCNQLETSLTKTEITRSHLLETTLYEALQLPEEEIEAA